MTLVYYLLEAFINSCNNHLYGVTVCSVVYSSGIITYLLVLLFFSFKQYNTLNVTKDHLIFMLHFDVKF